MMLQMGDVLGRYQILVGVSGGGILDVYQALDADRGRVVTIKVVRTGLAPNPAFRAHVLNCASRIAQFAQRGLVREFDYGEQEGLTYMVYAQRAETANPDRSR